MLCGSWLETSQDPICDAEQKGNANWWKVTQDFHERQLHAPFRVHRNRGLLLIQKRWSNIQQETDKFCAAIDHIVSHPVSGRVIANVVRPQPLFNLVMYMVLHIKDIYRITCLQVPRALDYFKAP
jgi:hypothetical protein